MKRCRFAFPWKWLTCLLVVVTLSARGETVVPCLIFKGNTGNRQSIDLSKFNRLSFDDDGMIVSSSNGATTEEIRLLYSIFNHIEIGDDVPSNEAGLDGNSVSLDSKLLFVSDDKSLKIETSSTNRFSVGVFNLKGALVATAKIFANDGLALEALVPGAYIAIASDGEIKLTLKFIIR